MTWDEALRERPTASLVVIAAGMSVPMAAWMLHQGMGRKNALDMSAVMLLPVIPFLGLVWFGVTDSVLCGPYHGGDRGDARADAASTVGVRVVRAGRRRCRLNPRAAARVTPGGWRSGGGAGRGLSSRTPSAIRLGRSARRVGRYVSPVPSHARRLRRHARQPTGVGSVVERATNRLDRHGLRSRGRRRSPCGKTQPAREHRGAPETGPGRRRLSSRRLRRGFAGTRPTIHVSGVFGNPGSTRYFLLRLR
jgi:hypothetical protein